MPELTVTEAALIDFQKGRKAIEEMEMARARNFDPTAYGREVEPGDAIMTPEQVAARI